MWYPLGNPLVTPAHELPTRVLYRKYRVQPAFPAGPDSVSLKDYRKQTQISRERVSQLIQVRREGGGSFWVFFMVFFGTFYGFPFGRRASQSVG